MDGRLFIRAALGQALVVGTIFIALVVSPLDKEFFRDWGAVVGPLAWIVAAAVTGRGLRLPLARVALAALLGGLASGVASVAGLHGAGLVVGVLVFGFVAATVPRAATVS